MQMILLGSIRKYFSVKGCRVEASHLISDANRLTGFCMGRSFTGKSYRRDHNSFFFTYLFFCFQFCFQVWRPAISTIGNPYTSLYEKWDIISEIFDSWKFKMSAFFLFLKKQSQKRTNFSTFKGLPFQYHKVRHPNFL